MNAGTKNSTQKQPVYSFWNRWHVYCKTLPRTESGNSVWGMLAAIAQNLAQIDHPFAIDPQKFYRRAARRRDAQHQRCSVTPGKMRCPLHLSRMIQGHELICHGIDRLGLVVFVVITTLTGQCQVIGRCFPTATNWRDVLDDKISRRKLGLRAAIFTVALGTIEYLLFQGYRHILSGHLFRGRYFSEVRSLAVIGPVGRSPYSKLAP
jgi:hypothetical protein